MSRDEAVSEVTVERSAVAMVVRDLWSWRLASEVMYLAAVFVEDS